MSDTRDAMFGVTDVRNEGQLLKDPYELQCWYCGGQVVLILTKCRPDPGWWNYVVLDADKEDQPAGGLVAGGSVKAKSISGALRRAEKDANAWLRKQPEWAIAPSLKAGDQ